MEIFWMTIVIVAAATGAIATVVRAIRLQEKELALFEPFDVAPRGTDQSK